MTDIEQKLLRALVACRDRFAFYVVHHCHKGDLDKASENNKFVERADAAIDAARQAEPLNFCSRCGKRLTLEGVHTCTPPMSRDAELDQARTMAATAEKWRGLATAKFGDGRTVQEIQREAAAAEREECAKVCEGRTGGVTQSREWWDGFKTATRQCAELIRARGQ